MAVFVRPVAVLVGLANLVVLVEVAGVASAFG
jgi:hypothetical protein